MLKPYGTLNLTDTSPAQTFTEPLTLAQVKSYLGIPSVTDTERDAELEAYIVAAREQAELLQQRDLVVKQWDYYLDNFGSYEIPLRPSLISVDLVQYTDSAGLTTTAVEDTDYIVDTHRNPGLLLPPYGSAFPSFVPWPSSAVLIRFTAGWTASQIPQLVIQGMQLLISAWYNNKLPFEIGASAIQEYPFAVTNCLRSGAVLSVR